MAAASSPIEHLLWMTRVASCATATRFGMASWHAQGRIPYTLFIIEVWFANEGDDTQDGMVRELAGVRIEKEGSYSISLGGSRRWLRGPLASSPAGLIAVWLFPLSTHTLPYHQ